MHDPSPLISVIIPFLNVEQFLGEAINSVLAQTYTHWELILVDDGSREGSRAVADKYCRRNPNRIRCIEHEGHKNRGISASRNLGRRNAAGTYIAFLDADDVWLPEKLERQIAILQTCPDAGLIVGATLYWYSWSGRLEGIDQDQLVPVGGPQNQLVFPPRLVPVLYPLGREAAPSVNTILVRSDLFDQVGGFEDSFRTAFEDQAFLIKIYLSAPVYISSDCCDRYRQRRPGSITATELTGEIRRRNQYVFYRWLEGYLKRHGLEGTQAWVLVQEALRRPGLERYHSPVLWRLKRGVLAVLRRGKRLITR